MADPSVIAREGFDYGVYAKNTSNGSQIWVDRVQRFNPSVNFRTNSYYELGRKGKIGLTQDPAEFRIVLEENLHSCELDFLLAGKNPNPAGLQEYNLGDLLGERTELYVLQRDESGAIDGEFQYTDCRIAEVMFRFTVRDAILATWNLNGTLGKFYTQNFPHSVWGPYNDDDPGGIHGKEARIWFGTSGSAAADREFRLQQFSIRATTPITPVAELGRRALVGQISGAWDVTFDFDLLPADEQPMNKLFRTFTDGYDLTEPSLAFDAYIRVFDPDGAEGANTLKAFKLENCRVVGGTPTQAQVRGLATARYNCTIEKETTPDSGGLIVRNRNF